MESKKQIYDLLPQQYYPQTIFFKADSTVEEILREIQKRNFQFPLIGKPDIGMKGLSVKKLHSEKELIDKRFILQIPSLKKTCGNELRRILQKGEKRILVPYGNHIRGAKFIDVSDLVDEKLTNTIDKICRQINGFYYGRLDIRFNSWEELRQGENISVIEVNGAGSEPTHIYDPKHSVFFAWKEIIRHWNILWKISRVNHHCYQLPYMKISSGIEMFRQNKEYVKMISEDLRQTA